MNSIFKGKGIIVGYTAALLLAAGLAFALSALPPGAGREGQEAAAAAKYKEALALMDGGSMDEAARAAGGASLRIQGRISPDSLHRGAQTV